MCDMMRMKNSQARVIMTMRDHLPQVITINHVSHIKLPIVIPYRTLYSHFFFLNDTATTEIYTLPLHDALPIFRRLENLQLLGLDLRPRLTGRGQADNHLLPAVAQVERVRVALAAVSDDGEGLARQVFQVCV